MSRTILLADDSLTIQKVVELSLTARGYRVVSVGDGAQAMARLEDVRPDLVLTDVIMPGKNGYELCDYIKKHPEHKKLPVLLLVGSSEPYDSRQAYSVGADDFIRKPFDSEALADKIEVLLKDSASAEPVTAENPADSSGPDSDGGDYDEIWESIEEPPEQTEGVADRVPEAAMVSESGEHLNPEQPPSLDELLRPPQVETSPPDPPPSIAASGTAPPSGSGGGGGGGGGSGSGLEQTLTQGLSALVQEAVNAALADLDRRIGPEVEQAVDRYLSTCLQPLVHDHVDGQLRSRLPDVLSEQLRGDTAPLRELVDGPIEQTLAERLPQAMEAKLQQELPGQVESAVQDWLDATLAQLVEPIVNARLSALTGELEARTREVAREMAAEQTDTRIEPAVERAAAAATETMVAALSEGTDERVRAVENRASEQLEARLQGWLESAAQQQLAGVLDRLLPEVAERVVERRLNQLEGRQRDEA